MISGRLFTTADTIRQKRQPSYRKVKPTFLFAVLFSVFWALSSSMHPVMADVEESASAAKSSVVAEGEPILSADGTEDYNAEAEERKSESIQSNEDSMWPQGPAIGAEGACLMNAETGIILYNKNKDEALYPASTTKLMTCLIAAEKLDLTDTVTMSEAALAPVGEGASNIGMDVGETITVEQALYGIMVGSANEVANAVAEKVSGSIDAFVDLMNERAAELGCTNTHFVTTNGLHDDNHYTTAHDLCLIAKAYFENDTLARIGNTPSYHFTATATQPDDFYLTNKHQLITGETPCDGVLGGKTGYTSLARETLVTAAERNGMTLICAVLKEESPYQFTDTVSLFDYGFNNFSCTDVSDNDSSVNFYDKPFLSNGKSPFGNNTETFSLAETGTVIVPTGYSISDLTSNIEYASDNSGNGTVTYSYGNTIVGTADLKLTKNGVPVSSEDSATVTEEDNKKTLFLKVVKNKIRAFYHRFINTNNTGTVFIDIRSLLIFISIFFVCFSGVIMIISYIDYYTKPQRIRKKRWKRNEQADSIGGFRRFHSMDSMDDGTHSGNNS